MTESDQASLIPDCDISGIYCSSAKLAEIYAKDIRSVQYWDEKGYIRPTPRGYNLVETVRGLDKAKDDIISKKKGPDGEELLDLEKREQKAKTEKVEIEVARLRGELVPASEVKSEQFTIARRTRDAIENIPSRIAAILAAETDEHKVRETLSHELKQALEGLSKNE